MCGPDSWETYNDNRPKFGTVGVWPSRIEEHERCGVTTEQFPQWWSNVFDFETDEWRSAEPDILPDNWFAILYEVADDYARIDNNQVIFDPAHAMEILRTQTDFPR